MAVILSGDKRTRDMLYGMIAVYGGAYGITEQSAFAVMDADTLSDSDIFDVASSGGLEDFPVLVIYRGTAADEEKRFARLIPQKDRTPVFLRRPFPVKNFLSAAAAVCGSKDTDRSAAAAIEIHLSEKDSTADLVCGAESVRLTVRETALLQFFLDRQGQDVANYDALYILRHGHLVAVVIRHGDRFARNG